MTRKQRSRFTDADFMRQREVFRAAFDGLRELPMPTIAAVHGYALGGGFESPCAAISSSPTRRRSSACPR